MKAEWRRVRTAGKKSEGERGEIEGKEKGNVEGEKEKEKGAKQK